MYGFKVGGISKLISQWNHHYVKYNSPCFYSYLLSVQYVFISQWITTKHLVCLHTCKWKVYFFYDNFSGFLGEATNIYIMVVVFNCFRTFLEMWENLTFHAFSFLASNDGEQISQSIRLGYCPISAKLLLALTCKLRLMSWNRYVCRVCIWWLSCSWWQWDMSMHWSCRFKPLGSTLC